MKDKYLEWNKVENIGILYEDRELVVGIEPVLFTCLSERGEHYLFMTYDSMECDYVFVKLNVSQLVAMLKNRMTMEKTFRSASAICETYLDEEEVIRYKEYSPEEFSASKLPERGEYFELSSNYIRDYIHKLKSEGERRIMERRKACLIYRRLLMLYKNVLKQYNCLTERRKNRKQRGI